MQGCHCNVRDDHEHKHAKFSAAFPPGSTTRKKKITAYPALSAILRAATTAASLSSNLESRQQAI